MLMMMMMFMVLIMLRMTRLITQGDADDYSANDDDDHTLAGEVHIMMICC